jgi:hypothetical protein
MLSEHHHAFHTLTEEVTDLVQTNRELLARGQRVVREVMASMGEGRPEGVALYGPGLVRDLNPGKPLLIDEAL